MRKVVQGILMELNENNAVIMTKSGEFLKVKKPLSDVLPGEEITSTISEKNWGIFRYAAIAAAIILLLLPFGYFKEAMATVAYVNIDINPSLEVGINKYNRITDVIALNEDGKTLLENISLKNLEIEKGVETIIDGAEDMGFIREDKQNNIEIALVKVKEDRVNISEENLLEYAKDTLDDRDVDVTVEVNSADKKDHDSAKKENMSTNKYLNKYEKQVDKSIKADVKKSGSNKEEQDKKNDSKDEKDKDTKNSQSEQEPNAPGLDKVNGNENKKNPSGVDKGSDKNPPQNSKEDKKQKDKEGSKSGNNGSSSKNSKIKK